MSEGQGWFKRVEHSYLQRFMINVVSSGTLPEHVAFIMDGNRRFATEKGITRVDSYKQGFDKIGEILDYCENFSIHTVSVYAFSIENFKRSEEERDELFDLMNEKLGYLMKEIASLHEKDVRVHIMGDISLFPEGLRRTLAELELATSDNSSFTLNLCLAYTARDEITTSVREIARGVESGSLKITDIDERLLERCLYSEDQPPVDMLVRTSGEVRLSDFLLWQTSFSALQFVPALWPDFSFWHFIGSILDYQRQAPTLKNYQTHYKQYLDTLTASQVQIQNAELGAVYTEQCDERREVFVQALQDKRRGYLEQCAAA